MDDLFAYADGSIRAQDWTDLEGLRELLESGRLAPRDPAGPERPSEPSTWRSRVPEPWTVDGFVAEAADEIERLSGRPTTSDRCWDAVRRFHEDPSERNRLLLRDAYLAVPPHRRIYVLGDMDLQDRPLRILVTDIGTAVSGDGPVVTAEMRRESLGYFDSMDKGIRRERETFDALWSDGPAGAGSPAVTLNETVYPNGMPEDVGDFVLRNEYPVPVEYGGRTYPSIVHAYWALAAADPADHDRIRDAPSVREAREFGGRAEHHTDWPIVRTAVMADLLRAKFGGHPDLAATLLATGDARISYTGLYDSPFWRDAGPREGRNWTGRLLELIRSELVVQHRESDQDHAAEPADG